VAEPSRHDFKFTVSPNPTTSSIKLIFLLPQNRSGLFEVYDIIGKKFTAIRCRPGVQNWILIYFLGNGVYHCLIRSEGYVAEKKLEVIRE
jgi:hypothetical protein